MTNQDPVAQHCIQYYQRSKSVYKCSKCADTYVLQDDGTCTQAANSCDTTNDNFYYQYVKV